MNLADVLKSLDVPENALAELAAVFGKADAAQHVLDIVNALIGVMKDVQALQPPDAAATPPDAPPTVA